MRRSRERETGSAGGREAARIEERPCRGEKARSRGVGRGTGLDYVRGMEEANRDAGNLERRKKLRSDLDVAAE